ncbi:MAG: biotin--[acetyl-CoA-carboxylase] ligase [Rickettsiales bacterium]|jgi:BirA family biotin operon repressor/biotin-[acetyl-CoA-carboxylase] ligase|nr:biotin--[acetyl-CoA-carboxylase] ligase [Rickettsiales bacterium]
MPNIIKFRELVSTQDTAMELVAMGRAKNKTVIVADMQHGGRGRYKRKWESPAGNLYCSFICNSPERNPTLSYTVAVAAAETLISFGITPKIKWPNDILVSGKKICGILIEYSKNFVVIGIGINVVSNPKLDAYETTRVNEYAPDVSRDEVLAELITQMDIWMKRDFATVRARWTELAASINETVRYRGTDAVLCGINEDGALVMRAGSKYIIAMGDEIFI